MILSRDGFLLFGCKAIRAFAHGWLAIALYKYLLSFLSEVSIGALFASILVGDVVISLILTTRADVYGRKKTLMIGALLMLYAGVTFALTENFVLLAFAGIVGVISPSGSEIGPFTAVEQACLTQLLKRNASSSAITSVFAMYALVGSLAMALGGVVGGAVTNWLLQSAAYSLQSAYGCALFAYSGFAIAILVLYCFLSDAVESPPAPANGEHLNRNSLLIQLR